MKNDFSTWHRNFRKNKTKNIISHRSTEHAEGMTHAEISLCPMFTQYYIVSTVIAAA